MNFGKRLMRKLRNFNVGTLKMDFCTRRESERHNFSQSRMEGVRGTQFVLNGTVIFLFVIKAPGEIFPLHRRSVTA